ncbi:MAG: hypothetical protein INQ03_22655 [Candidatus Heimdallarchaeota archaeon]|nr:hypothetical protein [Candidatus Heimdallarchaeota archaeon]
MSEYEFTKIQDREIITFAHRLVLLTIAFIFSGMIILILGLIVSQKMTDIATGSFFLGLALIFYISIQYFLNIVTTEGNDVKELVKGISSMSRGIDLVIVATLVMVLSIIYGYIQSL